MNGTQSLKEKVVRGSLIALCLSFLGSVFAYLIRIFYSRILTIEDYGLFYAVVSLFLIFTTYIDLGFGYSVVYFLPKYIKLKNFAKAWNIFIYGQVISVITSVIVSLFLIISASLLAKNYFKVEGSEILVYIFCVFLIAFTLMNGLIQIYSGLQKEIYYSSITVSRWFLTFIFSAIFFAIGFKSIIFFAIAWALGHLITVIFFSVQLFHKHQFLTANKLYWEKKTLKQMSSFAIPSLLEAIISSIFLMTVTFFLTLFKGVAEVGIYNIIFPLASIPIVLLTPLNALLLPLVSHLMEGEKSKLEYLTEKILKIIPFIGIYFSLFIIMFPSASVGLIFGQKWLGKVELPLTILSLGVVFLLMTGILGVIILGIGKVKERLKIGTVVAAASIILNALLIWKYGVMGAVIMTNLVALTLSLLFIKIMRKDLYFEIPHLFYFKLLIFSVVLFFLTRLVKLDPQRWSEFIIFGIIYTAVYLTFGYILKVYDKKMISIILPNPRNGIWIKNRKGKNSL